MISQKKSPYFLILSLVGLVVLIYLVLRPFLTPLVLALVFAFLFQPMYRYFLYILKGKQSIAALITTLMILMLIVVPILVLGDQIFKESVRLYSIVSDHNSTLVVTFQNITNRVYYIIPSLKNFDINIDQYFQRILDVIIQNLGTIFSNIVKTILDIFIFLMACYFFLKDGEKLKNYLVTINPLTTTENGLVVSRLAAGVLSVIKGSLLVALIQGVLAGVGFALLGVPNALLWGAAIVIAALIPSIGTALITMPAIAFALLTGNMFSACGILVLAVVVGLIDNVIRPKLVGNDIQLHPLGVFLMIIGGIAFFGPVGLVLGPLVMILFMTLVDIYFSSKEESVIL